MKLITHTALALFTLVTIAGFSKNASGCAFCKAMQLKSAKLTGAVARQSQGGGGGGAVGNGNSLSKDFFKQAPAPVEVKTDSRGRTKSQDITIVGGLYTE